MQWSTKRSKVILYATVYYMTFKSDEVLTSTFVQNALEEAMQ